VTVYPKEDTREGCGMSNLLPEATDELLGAVENDISSLNDVRDPDDFHDTIAALERGIKELRAHLESHGVGEVAA
jgi:hypothetical protein